MCVGRNTKSNGVTPEAQLQLRVKVCLGDELKEGIIDQLYSCALCVLCPLRGIFGSAKTALSFPDFPNNSFLQMLSLF